MRQGLGPMGQNCGPREQCSIGGSRAAGAMEGGGMGQESKARSRGLWEASTLIDRVALPLLLGSLQRAMRSFWWVGVWDDHSVGSTEDGREVNINVEGRPMDRGGKVRAVAVRTCFFRLDCWPLPFPAGALRQRGWR